MERKVLEILERDSIDNESIDISTLQGVIDLYLAHDYKRGMNLVINIGKIFHKKVYFNHHTQQKQQCWNKFEPIAKVILSPTTYEVTSNQTLSESAYSSLNKILSNAASIFDQFALQRDVICSLWGSDSAMKIINIVEHSAISGTTSPAYLEVISVAVVRCYLNALLCLNKLGQFYIVAAALLQVCFPFLEKKTNEKKNRKHKDMTLHKYYRI